MTSSSSISSLMPSLATIMRPLLLRPDFNQYRWRKAVAKLREQACARSHIFGKPAFIEFVAGFQPEGRECPPRSSNASAQLVMSSYFLAYRNPAGFSSVEPNKGTRLGVDASFFFLRNMFKKISIHMDKVKTMTFIKNEKPVRQLSHFSKNRGQNIAMSKNTYYSSNAKGDRFLCKPG